MFFSMSFSLLLSITLTHSSSKKQQQLWNDAHVIVGAINVVSGARALWSPPICPVPVLSHWPRHCGCQYICPLSSQYVRFSLFNLMVIYLSSFHPSFPLHSLCCSVIQQESVATQLWTSLSLFLRRPDLCWSRWESAVLHVTFAV